MADLRIRILSARKPVQPGSIAPEGNSPFGIFDTKKKGKAKHPSTNQAHPWADRLLRSIAGRQERVVLAVRDAARQAEKLGLNPFHNGIYVASSIRDAWNLKSDQLSKGLRSLEADRHIHFTEVRKGRHARFLLTLHKPDGTYPSNNISRQQK